MTQPIGSEVLSEFKEQLDGHPVYQAVSTLDDLQIFMQHHIYSVWDFMSLIKYLQSIVAPAAYPWLPLGDGSIRRFINELVLEEESDETHIAGEHSSHFELYQRAMQEVGADVSGIQRFLTTLQQQGIDAALQADFVPAPSAAFTRTSFDFIHSGKPHQVAAALALGREHIIPGMFRSILSRIGVTAEQAPIFHFYLNRHIHLDEDFHAPLSLRLLNALCDGDAQKTTEALEAANRAVQARLRFWDGVQVAIERS